MTRPRPRTPTDDRPVRAPDPPALARTAHPRPARLRPPHAARLFLPAEAALTPDEAGWRADAAAGLFECAVTGGWRRDGPPGFVYPTDRDGTPVVRDRPHRVVAEAISAAAALYRRTSEERCSALYYAYWDHADQYFIDHERGSWHHQLARRLIPEDGVWSGQPDLYHAFQATLGPRLPQRPILATAGAEGHLA